MKILHCCLSNFYIDGYNYQENVLPKINAEDGHDVKILASTETFIDNKKLGYIAPSSYITEYGVPIKRLPYKKIISNFISRKWRAYVGLMQELIEFSPDVILFHGCSGWELITVAKYKKSHPHVKFYVDSHEDFLNSATNWLSKNILHRIIYRYFFWRAKKQIDKVLCTSPLRFEFVGYMYKAPLEKLELYRMGGTIFTESEHRTIRNELRETYNIADEEILLLHAGKLDKLKKTIEMLDAFIAVPDPSLRLIIAGSVTDEIKMDFYSRLSTDARIQYIGWLTADKLDSMYCAADIYLQPGLHSVNVENAICKGCAIIASHDANQQQTVSDKNGWIIIRVEDITGILRSIIDNKEILQSKREESFIFAKNELDYNKLANRYTNLKKVNFVAD